MKKLGQSGDNPVADGANNVLDFKDKIVTDKNDQTKEEVKEGKDIKAVQNVLDSKLDPVKDRPVSGTVTTASQISTVPVQEKISPQRLQQVLAKKQSEDEKRAGLEVLKLEGHNTLIKAFKSGTFNFLVTCECQWQGRFVSIREANQGAAEHKRARKVLLNKDK